MEESSLLNMIRDLEVTVANIDTEMTNLSKGDLAKHLQAQSQNYLTKIQHLEADVSHTQTSFIFSNCFNFKRWSSEEVGGKCCDREVNSRAR